VRLAGPDKPIRCSVCLQPPLVFNPQPEYVDFHVGYDGPVVDNPQVPDSKVWIENIVICEPCLKEAAGLLGFGNLEQVQVEADSYREYAKNLEDEIADKDGVISDLHHTVATLIDKPIKRPARKPQIKGPESHQDELKEMRSRRAKSEKVKKAQAKAGA
jgi:hypothetical protein